MEGAFRSDVEVDGSCPCRGSRCRTLKGAVSEGEMEEGPACEDKLSLDGCLLVEGMGTLGAGITLS